MSQFFKRWFKNLNFTSLFPLFVLILGLSITQQLWDMANQAAYQELKQKFNFQAQEIEALIKQRLRAYTQVLHGGKGLFTALDSHFVTRQEFQAYVNELQLEKFYPGIQGLAFSVLVPVAEKEAHIAKIQQQGFPNYKIYPEGERDEFYTAIIYIEPFSDRNLRAFGYDMYSESVRRKAMERARDENVAAMSGKITLVQETDSDVQAGFIIYLPLFRNGADISTLEGRRQHIIGWQYAVFRMDDLMQGIWGNRFKNLDVNIYDQQISTDSLMHNNYEDELFHNDDFFEVVKKLEIAGHIWVIDIHSHADFEILLDFRTSNLIGITGICGSIMLAWIIWLLVNGRKRALQTAQQITLELSERETRYRQMFEDNSCAAVLVHPQTGLIIDANSAASEFWGYSREELHRMNLSQINTTSPEKLQDIFKSILTNSQCIQTQHRLKNNERREIEVYAGPITYQSETVLYATFHDITSRIQSEKALQESEARWKFAIEGSGDGVWDWNITTGEVIFSKRWKEMLGYLDHEIKSNVSEWEKRIHPDDKERVKAVLNDYMAGKTMSYVSEHRVLCKDGSWKWVLDRGVVVRSDDQGQPQRLVGTHTDISIQKETETVLREAKIAAIQANRAKSEFLANMSHEIRTPMNAILGFTSILSDIIADPVQRRYLDAIDTSGKTLLQLINDILDLSKIEAGKLKLQYEAVSIRLLCEDIYTVFSQKILDNDLDFILDIADDVPDYLILDETRLRQVLLNLVGNAVKFTEKGFIRIQVMMSPNEDNDSIHLTIVICDTGIGIAPDQQKKIFSAFTQQELQNNEYGGTGLGLTICKRLLELMNGKIRIDSELDKGSCFSIDLENIEISQQQTHSIKESPQKVNELQFFPAKILVVDDISFNRQLIHSYLSDFKALTLIDAENGQQALALCLAEQPDLVLMDKKLPDESGDIVCQKIKALPECAHIPAIMVTASVLTLSEQKKSYNLQLNKPLKKQELISALASFLKTSKETPINEIEELQTNDITITAINGAKLIETLKTYQARILQIKTRGSWDINLLTETAEQLIKLAQEHDCEALDQWAQQLKAQAELFDLSALPATLNSFETLLIQLDEKI